MRLWRSSRRRTLARGMHAAERTSRAHPATMPPRLSSRRTFGIVTCESRPPLVLLMVFSVAVVRIVSCGTSATTAVSTAPTLVKCQLSLTQPAPIAADGGIGTLSITAAPECAWSVTMPAGWVSDPSPASGQGSGNIEFRAATNPIASTREGEIVVNDSRVRVIQDAAPCRFAIAPEDQRLPAGATDATFAVSTNGCAWSAQSNAGWIAISSSGVVSFHVSSNSGRQRSGTLTIAGLTHTITQVDVSAPAAPTVPAPQPPALPAPQPAPPSGGKAPKPPKPPKPPKTLQVERGTSQVIIQA